MIIIIIIRIIITITCSYLYTLVKYTSDYCDYFITSLVGWFYVISTFVGYSMPNSVYTNIHSSSSSSCRAASTNIPDPLSPLLPIVHRFSQVLRATSRILTELLSVRAGRPAFAQPCEGVHKRTSLMSSSLLLQQCPACPVRLTLIVFVMGGSVIILTPRPGLKMPFQCNTPEGSDTSQRPVIERDRVGGLRLMIW